MKTKSKQARMAEAKMRDPNMIDPLIQPIVQAAQQRGLPPFASCAGLGPSPYTQRNEHAPEKMPFINIAGPAYDIPSVPAKRATPEALQSLLKTLALHVVDVDQHDQPPIAIDASVYLVAKNGQSGKVLPGLDFINHHMKSDSWMEVEYVTVCMFTYPESSFVSFFPAMIQAGVNLAPWLTDMKTRWLMAVQAALRELPVTT